MEKVNLISKENSLENMLFQEKSDDYLNLK